MKYQPVCFVVYGRYWAFNTIAMRVDPGKIRATSPAKLNHTAGTAGELGQTTVCCPKSADFQRYIRQLYIFALFNIIHIITQLYIISLVRTPSGLGSMQTDCSGFVPVFSSLQKMKRRPLIPTVAARTARVLQELSAGISIRTFQLWNLRQQKTDFWQSTCSRWLFLGANVLKNPLAHGSGLDDQLPRTVPKSSKTELQSIRLRHGKRHGNPQFSMAMWPRS